ncbi:MAG: 30S ribosomal protein S3 [Dehalococcoidia bacterium]|nr:30S ribosomal protein S3 [Candidatus Omnitrophota bacterium]MDD5313514.1 30S ribosomal protein S3 [Dehalococcoidia bacterium]MDD5494626.1 30S ribosomal protein S3 [Dehalococcoidia bacterium]
MGHKVHPYGFRIGVIRGWKAKWYDEKHYLEALHDDLKLRKVVKIKLKEGAVARVEIDRQGNDILVTIFTARPGIVIGRGGQRAEELRSELEKQCGKKVKLSIKEVEQPELEAMLVARNVADQLERRVTFRRAMKQAAFKTRQAGAKGIKISCAGRLGGAEIARRETIHEGRLPLHTLSADIDYGLAEAATTMGNIGVKVWIYKGNIIPEVRRESATTETSEVS